MFESILEKVLNNVLGEYIQGLNKDALSVSIWGGDIELRDVLLRNDIFDKFKLPLDLVFGKIGYLSLNVPWKKLGSKPVIAIIEDIRIIVRPKTDPSQWQMIETLETSFQKKDEHIAQIMLELFQEMIKTPEEKAKEQGMFAGLVTKIIDNLQVSIKNLHVRIEKEDYLEKNNQFSLGVTLQEVDLHTTNSEWQRIYVDRTVDKNKGQPMFKLFQIQNFGVYYKTAETTMISTAQSHEEMSAVLESVYSTYDESGRIAKQSEDYLIQPIKLKVKMRQNDPLAALQAHEALLQVYLRLEEFGIVLQKGQYDNIQMLLELTSDYMRFLNYETLTFKKKLLKEMNMLLKVMNLQPSKRTVRQIFKEVFSRHLELIIVSDPKKPEKLQAAKISDLQTHQQAEIYEKICSAMDTDDLIQWSKEVVTDRVVKYKQEMEIKKANKSKGFFSGLFSSNAEKDARAAADKEKQQARLQEIEAEIREQAAELQQVQASIDQRKQVPNFVFNFELGGFSLTIINDTDLYQGVQIYSKNLNVDVNLFDGSNKLNKKTMSLNVSQENLVMWVVERDEFTKEVNHSPLLQQLVIIDEEKEEEFKFDEDENQPKLKQVQPLTKIFMSLGNVIHHESDLPQNEIDQTDLELSLHLRPMEFIYRAQTVKFLTRFLKVKNLKDKTKLAAKEQFGDLSKQVQSITQNLEQDFQNNKISIKIDAPTFVLPFNQSNIAAIEDSECWLFTMGDFTFVSFSEDSFDYEMQEGFKLSIERVKFELASKYIAWKNRNNSDLVMEIPPTSPILTHQHSSDPQILKRSTIRARDSKLKISKVLEDFTTSVILLKRRNKSEMRTPALMEKFNSDKSPLITVQAQFDNDLMLCLKPSVFKKLVKIGDLLIVEKKLEEYYITRRQKKIDKARHAGSVRLVTFLGVKTGKAAVQMPDRLYFWPDDAPENEILFDLSGCEKGGLRSNGLDMILTNQDGRTCEIRFLTHEQTQIWLAEMSLVLRDIDKLKKEGFGRLNETQDEISTIDDSKDDNEVEQKSEVIKDQPNLKVTFSAPRLCLELITTKKVLKSTSLDSRDHISKNLQNQIDNTDDWRLQTILEKITFELYQFEKELLLSSNVSSLKVKDNQGDQRFPYIFQNQSVEGQQELVSFTLKQLEKSSSQYEDCEVFIDLGFSGLIAYWKPQTMINLLEFINENSEPPKKKKNKVDLLATKTEKNSVAPVQKDQNPNQDDTKVISTEYVDGLGQTIRRHKGCKDKIDFQVKINIKLAYLKSIFIHPDNITYPIFSLQVKQTEVDFWKKCDCSQINIKLQNMQVFDNTNYPNTLTPAIMYTHEYELVENEIVGLNKQTHDGDLAQNNFENMLELQFFLFDFPNETRCANQPSQDFNMHLQANLKQIKLLFMMENTMRIIDYTLNHVSKLFMIKAVGEEGDLASDDESESVRSMSLASKRAESVADFESYAYGSEADVNNDFWADFDLQQEQHIPKLDLFIACPLIIMPNLNDDKKRFEFDMGSIRIENELVEQEGRWVNHPRKKIKLMAITIQNKNLSFEFKDEGSKNVYDPVLKEDELFVNLYIPNTSPFFEVDKKADAKGPKKINQQGQIFDMSQIDVSVEILIKQNLLKLRLMQDVITELFNTLEHNIKKKDEFSVHFSEVLSVRQATIARIVSTQNRKKAEQTAVKYLTNRDQEYMSDGLSDEEKGNANQFKHKKKEVQITIQATCLSIEIRDVSDYLICEFCMVNFDYGLQVFSDQVQRIYMHAHSFFLLHDEDPMTNTKQVMFGHINCVNQVVTNDEFYRKLPEMVRAKEIAESGIGGSGEKKRIIIEVIIDPNRRMQVIKVEFSKLKLYMRPQVFKELSQFLITALKELDLKSEQEEQDRIEQERRAKMIKNDDSFEEDYIDVPGNTNQGSKMIFKAKLSESILVLERRELIKKAFVVKMATDFKMSMNDQKAIERQIENQKLKYTRKNTSNFRNVQDMQIKVLKVTPFIININDLETKKFKSVKKRELAQAFDLDLSMSTKVCKAEIQTFCEADEGIENKSQDADIQLLDAKQVQVVHSKLEGVHFLTKNEIKISMSQISAQVSMNDLFVVQQLAFKVLEEFQDISHLWLNYTETAIETTEDKKRKSNYVLPESTIDFQSEKGVDIVIINEDKGNFIPMLLVQSEKVNFNMLSGIQRQNKSKGNAETICGVYYYNIKAGFWEPAVERFAVQIDLLQHNLHNVTILKFPQSINVNVSVNLIGVVTEFSRLWGHSQKRAEQFQEKIKRGDKNALRDSTQLFFTRSTQFQKIRQENIMLLDDKAANDDIVTPYAIQNLTDRSFKVFPITGINNIRGNGFEVNVGEKKGIAMSSGDTLESATETDGTQKRRTFIHKDQFVQIEFGSKNMRNISKMRLNQQKQHIIHNVFPTQFDFTKSGSTPPPNLNLNREEYILENSIQDNKRVITVRTKYIIINQTFVDYKMRQFFVNKKIVDGKEVKEVNIYNECVLKPGQAFPMPDDRDITITDKLKICIRPLGCKKWSDEYKIPALKEKIKNNENVLWRHYKTYSILRKEEVGTKGVFNFLILPPLIIKNCLPFPLTLSLRLAQKTEDEMKSNLRTGNRQENKQGLEKLNARVTDTDPERRDTIMKVKDRMSKERDLVDLGSHDFARGEEKHFEEISTLAEHIEIIPYIKKGLRGQALKLKQDNKGHDIELALLFRDELDRQFPIYAKVQTQRAGNRVVFFAKDVILSHTHIPLEFFYEKKQGVFENDRSHEFPHPVRDNRMSKDLQKLKSALSFNEEESHIDEPTIIIHKKYPRMVAALQENTRNKSNYVNISNPGIEGHLQIEKDNHIYEFSCNSGNYQPSKIEDDIQTKVVEVSPFFIVANLTKQTVYFGQEYLKFTKSDDVLELKPKQRKPFHWTAKDSPRLVMFYTEGAKTATAKFTLNDLGSVQLMQENQDGSKEFFRVTKRKMLNSIFIVIQETQHPPYLIKNDSKFVNIQFSQVGMNDAKFIKDCLSDQSRPFAWIDLQKENQLNVKFFHSNGESLFPVTVQGSKEGRNVRNKKTQNSPDLQFNLDKLNTTHEVKLTNLSDNIDVYVSLYTNSHSKVFEVSDHPSKNIVITERQKQMAQKDELDNQVVEVGFDGNASIISLPQESKLGAEDDPSKKVKNEVKVDIKEVTLSFIRSIGVEVMSLSISQMQIMQLQTAQEIIYEAIVGRLQLDNQGQEIPLYPVIFKPKCTVDPKVAHDHITGEGVDKLIEFYCAMQTNIPNVQYISWFEFLWREMELKLEVDHLMQILDFMNELKQQNANLRSSHPVFIDQDAKKRKENANDTLAAIEESDLESSAAASRGHKLNNLTQSVDLSRSSRLLQTNDDADEEDEIEEEIEKLQNWKSNLINQDENTVYIEHYIGSPLSFTISLFKRTQVNDYTSSDKDNSEESKVDVNSQFKMIQNFGLSLTTISNAPLKLNALEIENIYGTQGTVIELLQEHYMSNIKANALALVGSVEFLGNPTNFVNSLGTGVKSFFYEPKEGFMKGPLQGGIGLIKGTGKMLSHTAGGVAGALSKVTNTVNRGILHLTFDDQYRADKEVRDIVEKPKGVMDGIGKGAKNFGMSLFNGVTGVFTEPIKGAKSQGIVGFGKGIGKGVAGAIVKPIGGAIDVISKTTEGIESAVDGQMCEQNNQKQRPSRAFYKETKIFQEYNRLHAEAYAQLRNTSRSRNEIFASSFDIFYGAFKMEISAFDDDVIDTPILMISQKFTVMFDKDLRVTWVRANYDISLGTEENPCKLKQGTSHYVKIKFEGRLSGPSLGGTEREILIKLQNEEAVDSVLGIYKNILDRKITEQRMTLYKKKDQE